jgi:hypothetical protein
MRFVRKFLREQAGAAAAIFALSAPVISGSALLAVDLATLVRQRASLQDVVDASALAGAKELHLYQTRYSALQESVRERALALVSQRGLDSTHPAVEVSVDAERGTVTVTSEAAPETILLGPLGYLDRIATVAVARAFGSVRLCVLTLDGDGSPALHGTGGASLEAAECAVQSNSRAADGIEIDGRSSVTARAICSSGGVEGSDFTPAAQTDCPPIDDPLAGRPVPDPGPCTANELTILLPRTISPGHYCGGLTLGPTALVRAQPGEYVISGGPLVLGPAASLTGDGVSFRFIDEQSTFSFGLGSIVELSAPTTGPMAGFLFYQEPGLPKGMQFLIGTDLATKLLGTIYLPSGTLNIDVLGLVAAESAYTVIVADRLDVKRADLVINSDYGATDVPVPQGVGPTGGSVSLAR